MPGEPSLRFELKLACQESAYERVRMALRLHPAGVRPLHPTRVVQSIYLDTPFGRALEENLAGVGRRSKLRFRWYGDADRQVRGTLEVKHRVNSLGWKDLYPVSGELEVTGMERRTFVRALADGVEEEARRLLEHGLEPVQWVRYERDYLTTADGRVRVTLDRALRTWDQRFRRRIARSAPTPLPRLLVIEAKCAEADYTAARQLLSRLTIPVDRCSKFVLASAPAHGPAGSLFPE